MANVQELFNLSKSAKRVMSMGQKSCVFCDKMQVSVYWQYAVLCHDSVNYFPSRCMHNCMHANPPLHVAFLNYQQDRYCAQASLRIIISTAPVLTVTLCCAAACRTRAGALPRGGLHPAGIGGHGGSQSAAAG